MKKYDIKRFMALTLSAAMVITGMSIPAFAAQDELTEDVTVESVNETVEKSVNMLHNIVSINKEIRAEERNMLHPSYTDLMEAANAESENEEQPVVQSRYSIVMAASKRARQLVDGAEPELDEESSKPLSIAIDEIYSQKVKILGSEVE